MAIKLTTALITAAFLLLLSGCGEEQPTATAAEELELQAEQSGAQKARMLPSPIVSEDGSIHGDEPYVRKQAELYKAGDVEQKKTAIIDLELSEGGVILLSHIIRNDPSRSVVVEAIQRLDLGEEFGARWALLDALDHKDPDVVLEILAAVEVWRDPTIRRYIVPLANHPDERVSAKSADLLEDLRIYADLDEEVLEEEASAAGQQ